MYSHILAWKSQSFGARKTHIRQRKESLCLDSASGRIRPENCKSNRGIWRRTTQMEAPRVRAAALLPACSHPFVCTQRCGFCQHTWKEQRHTAGQLCTQASSLCQGSNSRFQQIFESKQSTCSCSLSHSGALLVFFESCFRAGNASCCYADEHRYRKHKKQPFSRCYP